MKKRTAILLFGSLFVSTVGYVAWCFRCFYLPPGLEISGAISPGGLRAVEDWRWSESFPRPLEFKWSTAWSNLRYPWHCVETHPVEVDETPGWGLWARTFEGNLWGFSKVGNEWDASTAFHHGSFHPWVYYENYRKISRQRTIASRIEEWGSGGATIEILSLGPLTTYGRLLELDGQSPDLGWNYPEVFYNHEVIGRVTVVDSRERQELFDGFARSVREAVFERDPELPGWRTHPRLGIILTRGEQRAEYLVSFETGEVHAFEDALEGIDAFHEVYELQMFEHRDPGKIDPNESMCYFKLSSRYQGVFDAILDKHGIERGGQVAK